MRALRRIGTGVAAAAVLLTAGCAAGQVAETANEKATLDGVNVSVGQMKVRALSIKAPSGTSYAVGSSPTMRLVLVNNGRKADQLTSISSPIAGGWANYPNPTAAAVNAPNQLSAGDTGTVTAPVTVKPGQRVTWGVPETTRTLVLLDLKKRLYPGNTVKMTLTFAKAGSVTTKVPIQLTDGHPEVSVPAVEGDAEEG